MSRKLYLHIGPPKTGTSALQWFLRKQRDCLLQSGILYPEDDAHNWSSHRRLGFALRQKRDPKNGDIPDFATTLRHIREQIDRSQADTVILSSEEFFVLRPESVDRLIGAFSDFRTCAIFYARRQDDAYVSSFTQRIKVPRRRLVDSIHSCLDHPPRMSRGLDYNQRARIWAKYLGKDRIIPRLYDEVDDVRTDFMKLTGNDKLVELAETTEPESSNRSPTLEAIEHIRAFKIAIDNSRLYAPASRTLIDHFSCGQKPGALLSTDDRRRILEYFRTSNEKFFSDFLGVENRFDPALLLSGPKAERVLVDTSNTVELVEELLLRRRKARLEEKVRARSGVAET
ncbi:MAG: hypothetical protein CMI62_17115 [Parvibaculum sp.]|uniref:hypothetical protein n=1 Tax=Parvibaculum sp. TaxID=2024848 RepID=UPI000C4BEC83|nr:hypothetical protein [Parvibaculum sp.]MAU61265.1 hypothetical protein [Parvibaculum sp.]MAU62444.1 hypothetical protein [Parvibaculum sp.]